jgi:hypothetical protein
MSNSSHDTITKTLSSVRQNCLIMAAWVLIFPKPPPPTLEEILGTFSSQEDGDKELLEAIVRAKEAEELVGVIQGRISTCSMRPSCQRVAAVASLQETIMQLQHALAQASGLIPSPRTPPRRSQASKTARRRAAPNRSASRWPLIPSLALP